MGRVVSLQSPLSTQMIPAGAPLNLPPPRLSPVQASIVPQIDPTEFFNRESAPSGTIKKLRTELYKVPVFHT